MKKLKDVLIGKIEEASSKLCDSLQVISKGVKDEVISTIPIIPNMAGGMIVNTYKEEYAKLLIYHEWEVVDEGFNHVKYGAIRQCNSCIYIQAPSEMVIEESRIENDTCSDIAFYENHSPLKDHLEDIIKSCRDAGGWGGIYVRSSRTTKLLMAFHIPTTTISPKEENEYWDFVRKTLEIHKNCPIICQRTLIKDFGPIRTGFMEIFIDDDPVCVPDTSGDRCDLIRILLKELGKENALDACDKVTIIFKDQEDKLIDCADITF